MTIQRGITVQRWIYDNTCVGDIMVNEKANKTLTVKLNIDQTG